MLISYISTFQLLNVCVGCGGHLSLSMALLVQRLSTGQPLCSHRGTETHTLVHSRCTRTHTHMYCSMSSHTPLSQSVHGPSSHRVDLHSFLDYKMLVSFTHKSLRGCCSMSPGFSQSWEYSESVTLSVFQL